ncbi:MAG: acylphosphatase [Hyphomicrobiales bacterium]|nr:acylphosphatase [Hyphomicrobiales bacterium]
MQAARLRLVITGRVQGVGFRAFLAREGVRLGLTGWARNLEDGRVETEFAGAAGAVEEMRAACGRGPAHARVERVDSLAPGAGPLPSPFAVRRDA